MEELDKWLGSYLKSPVAQLIYLVVVLFARLVLPSLANHRKAKRQSPKRPAPSA